MADTRVQHEVEDWVRENWLPAQFNQQFRKQKMQLSTGGEFEFDAVSQDLKIVASISTSGYRTATGKGGTGKLQKIKSDISYLLGAPAERRIVILTENDMLQYCQMQAKRGRIDCSIEFALALIPQDLRIRLQIAKATASKEVSP